MKKLVLVIIFLIGIISYAQYDPALVPQRIVLNLTSNPATSIAVTWRTIGEYSNSEIEYSTATPGISFQDAIVKVKAKEEKLEIAKDRFVFHYSAIIDRLNPNTKYVYRVGHDSVWSEWNQFTTASAGVKPFNFVYFGDPQNDIKEHVSRVLREAYKNSPDAAFWLFTGDLVTNGDNDLWGELFYAAGFIFGTTPSIMTPGNHDTETIEINGKKTKITRRVYRSHFTLPENGVKGTEEASYCIDYQGVRFIMIRSNDKDYNLKEQSVWLDSLLSNNPSNWTVIASHYPMYNTGRDDDNKLHREILLPIIDKHSVDLVLQGHDHTYFRTHKLRNNNVVADSKKGTIYVGSTSGPKSYKINYKFQNLMAKLSTGIQLFQVISIDKNKIIYKSFTADGTLYDSFELMK